MKIVKAVIRDNRKSWQHGNHKSRDFHQMPWFCQNAMFCHVFFTKIPWFLHFFTRLFCF